MQTTRIPTHTCICGATNSAASHSELMPEPGNLSICAYCGELTIFNDDLSQRAITEEEIAAYKEHPDAWRRVEEAQIFIRTRSYDEK